MNRKAIILVLYGVALFIVLRQYYKTNSGLPSPQTIRNPTYLYALLAIATDIIGGAGIVIAAGATVALAWQAQNAAKQQQQQAKQTQQQESGAFKQNPSQPLPTVPPSGFIPTPSPVPTTKTGTNRGG